MRKLPAILLFLLLQIAAAAQDKDWRTKLESVEGRGAKIDWIYNTVKEARDYKQSYKEIYEAMALLTVNSDPDSTKAKLSFCYAKYLQRKGDIETAFEAAKKTMALAMNSRSYPIAAEALLTQCQLLLHMEKGDSIIALIDRNRFLYSLCKDRSTLLRLKTMHAVGQNDEAAALKEFTALVDEGESIPDTATLLALYTNIGRLQENPDSTMLYFRKVMVMSRDRYPNRYVSALFQIGYGYLQRDGIRKDSALFFLLEAEKRADDAESPVFKMNLYNVIGVYFTGKEEHAIALKYYRKAYAHSSPSFAKTNIVILNIASAFTVLNMPDSAAYYLDVCKKRIDVSRDDYDYLNYYQAKAEYESKKQKDSCNAEALRDYNHALYYAQRLQNTWHGINMLTLVIPCYEKSAAGDPVFRKMADTVLQYCAFFYEASRHEDRLLDFSAFLNKYAALESLYGDRQKAIRLYQELASILTRINEENYSKGIGEMLVKYKSDLKDTEILYGRKMNTLLTGGAVLLLLSMIMMFIIQRRTSRFNRQISIQKNELEKLNNTQQVLFSVISHDLRAPISSLNAVVNVLGNDKDYAHKMPQYTRMLSESLDNAEYLLNNLLLWTRTQMQGYQVTMHEDNIRKLFEENISLFSKDADKKSISVSGLLHQDLFVNTDHHILRIVIRNLLNNAIKFTASSGVISLNAWRENDMLIITVEDSGVGMNAETQQKLFDKTTLYTTAGTAREKGTGLGLSLCKELLGLLNGTITVYSEETKGSVFTVSVPLG